MLPVVRFFLLLFSALFFCGTLVLRAFSEALSGREGAAVLYADPELRRLFAAACKCVDELRLDRPATAAPPEHERPADDGLSAERIWHWLRGDGRKVEDLHERFGALASTPRTLQSIGELVIMRRVVVCPALGTLTAWEGGNGR